MKKIISSLLLCGILLSFAACGENQPEISTDAIDDGTTQPISTEGGPVLENDFSQTGMLATGQSVQLTTELSGDITWSVSDPEKATVDSQGVVTAQQDRGTVDVIASSGDKTENWTIRLCQKTQFGSVALNSVNDKLTIGVWNGNFQWFDETYSKLMADAGINLLIGVKNKWIWEGDGAPMLDLGQQYGISYLVDLREWDGYTVPEYVDHPALIGFVMFDEPNAPHFTQLVELKKQFEAVMPENLMFFVNLFPEACSYESVFGYNYDPNYTDYEQHYQNLFVDMLDPACLSYDAYALQEGGYIRHSYYHNFDVAAYKAKNEGIPFWYTLCTSGHWTTDGRYVTPTDKELRWQMALGMTYGAKALNHYVLSSPDEGDENMLEAFSWEPTQIYYHVKQVNLEYLAWDDIYLSYDWVGTAALDSNIPAKWGNQMLTSLEYDLSFDETGILTGAESDQDLLIGVFEKNGQNAYMVTNAGDCKNSDRWLRYFFEMDDAAVTLQLAQGDYQCAAVISRGHIQYVPVNADYTVSISVPAYEGVFVIPIANS